jgi:protein ImuA
VICAEPSPDPAADRPPTLCEVFAATATDGAATGFVLAQLASGRGPVLWVQDRVSRREGGRPFASGLASLTGRPVEVLYLEVGRPIDVLWAMEEALGCATLSAVIGEVWGDPPALDFTATKRLALRAERGGVQAWLLRRAASADLSAARERWRVVSQPTLPCPDDLHAPGEPLWLADLFRSRQGRTGTWLARHDATARGSASDAPATARGTGSAGRTKGSRSGMVLRLASRPGEPDTLGTRAAFASDPQATSCRPAVA